MSRSACLSINSDEAGVESCELVKIYTSRQQVLRGAIGAHRANGRAADGRRGGWADKIIPSRLVKGGGYYILNISKRTRDSQIYSPSPLIYQAVLHQVTDQLTLVLRDMRQSCTSWPIYGKSQYMYLYVKEICTVFPPARCRKCENFEKKIKGPPATVLEPCGP